MQAVAGVAGLLDDQRVTALLRHYRDNESYEDLQVEQDKVADADSDDEEDVNSDDEEDAEIADSTDEADTAPKLTPEAAKQVRVELLKKFLEVVEARMKLTPAN
jgi:hypothetical protein